MRQGVSQEVITVPRSTPSKQHFLLSSSVDNFLPILRVPMALNSQVYCTCMWMQSDAGRRMWMVVDVGGKIQHRHSFMHSTVRFLANQQL